jgi:hypothetical protein
MVDKKKTGDTETAEGTETAEATGVQALDPQVLGECSRAILSLVRKSRYSDEGLVAELSGQYDEQTIKDVARHLVSTNQIYTEGQGRSQGYRAGQSQ